MLRRVCIIIIAVVSAYCGYLPVIRSLNTGIADVPLGGLYSALEFDASESNYLISLQLYDSHIGLFELLFVYW